MACWLNRGRVLTAMLLVSLVVAGMFVESDAAKKKKSKAKGSDKNKIVDKLRCGVCFAAVDEIQYDLRSTENSTNTLDLRWGLTAEVTEGRAKRIGKVIPYKRSELRSIEVMEKVCETMRNYGEDRSMPGEVWLRRTNKRPDEERDMEVFNSLTIDSDSQKKYERFCDDVIEGREDLITASIRDGHDAYAMEDYLCFGKNAPCGESRPKCGLGSYGSRNGVTPCKLCPNGEYQDEVGQTTCKACATHFNTTDKGSNSSSQCIAECKPGFFGAKGLEPCEKCGIGMFQSEYGKTHCERCPDGKSTHGEASMFLTECVSICGDGRQSTEEECDDGNVYPGDGCGPDCKVEVGHFCAGNVGGMHSCNKVVCGDNRTDTSNDGTIKESCDDGNTEDGDGCTSTCQIEEGVSCVPQQDGGSKCNKVVCGDGRRQSATDGSKVELCDDGNTENGDGCSETCQFEDGWMCQKQPDEKWGCHSIVCGDGLKEVSGTSFEQCDDGNNVAGDGCSPTCQAEENWDCADGTARRGWAGIPAHGGRVSSHEKSICTVRPYCGDGKRQTGETCDDGNQVSDDGCSSECTTEPGFMCYADRRPDVDGNVPGPDEEVPDLCVNSVATKRKADGEKVEL